MEAVYAPSWARRDRRERLSLCFWLTGILRRFALNGGSMKWQQHHKLRASADHAADFDAPVVVFHDAPGERKAKASAVALGSVERPENIGQMLGSDTAAGVADRDGGIAVLGRECHAHCAGALHCLDRIQEKVQKHLVDLVAIVL